MAQLIHEALDARQSAWMMDTSKSNSLLWNAMIAIAAMKIAGAIEGRTYAPADQAQTTTATLHCSSVTAHD